MSAQRDPDGLIHAFLLEGAEQLHDQVYDAVRADIEHTRQRAVIGPWRMPDIMNKYVPIALGAAVVVAVLVIGSQLFRPPDSSGVGDATAETPSPTLVPPQAPPSPTGGLGGTVNFVVDGTPATTVVDVVADGASVSGTAVTTFRDGNHTVRLECAARDGEFWALGGTVEQSTAEAGSVGAWSAVIVKDGSPQQIAVWRSDDKSAESDCAAWLALNDLSGIDRSFFSPVESGALVPPPDLAP